MGKQPFRNPLFSEFLEKRAIIRMARKFPECKLASPLLSAQPLPRARPPPATSHYVSRSTGFRLCHLELCLLATHRMINRLVPQDMYFHPVLTGLHLSQISTQLTRAQLHKEKRKQKLSLNSVKR